MSINREDPVEGTLTGRLEVLRKDRRDKKPPSASDSMWERRGREEERAQHPESLLSIPSKDGGYGRVSLSPGAGPLGPHGCPWMLRF